MKFKSFFSRGHLFLLTVVLLSLALRWVGQPDYPSCLHRDEVQYGYNAYSILKTGRDEWGKFLPLHFKYNGEYIVPMVFYLISLAMIFVGPADVVIRLPSIILGSLIPVLGFYFAQEFTKNKKIPYLFALLLALNPWQIINARASGELSIITLFFGLMGFLLLFRFLKEKRKIILLLSIFCFILAYFSYIASRLDVPLLLLAFLFFFFKKIPFKKLSVSLLLLTILLPFLLVLIYPKRFVGTSLVAQRFFPEDEKDKVQLRQLYSQGKIKFFTLQTKGLLFDFIDNYFDYLNPYYIFRNMGEPDRTNIPQSGSLYLVEFAAVIFGLYVFSKTEIKEETRKHFLLSCLFLSPVVGALTYNYPDRPNVARTVYLYFILTFFSAYGFFSFFQYLKKNWMQKVYCLTIFFIFSLNFLFIVKQLIVYSPAELARARNCGYAELFNLTEDLKENYSSIYIGTEYEYPYVYYLWQTKYPPEKYHQFLKENPPENGPVLIHTIPKHDWKLENYVFKHRWCLIDKEEGALLVGNFNQCKEKYNIRVFKDERNNRLLFVLPDNEGQIVYQNVGEIKRDDGKTVFNIYTYEKKADVAIGTEEMKFFNSLDDG